MPMPERVDSPGSCVSGHQGHEWPRAQAWENVSPASLLQGVRASDPTEPSCGPSVTGLVNMEAVRGWAEF
jgi:hypothetical protein